VGLVSCIRLFDRLLEIVPRVPFREPVVGSVGHACRLCFVALFVVDGVCARGRPVKMGRTSKRRGRPFSFAGLACRSARRDEALITTFASGFVSTRQIDRPASVKVRRPPRFSGPIHSGFLFVPMDPS